MSKKQEKNKVKITLQEKVDATPITDPPVKNSTSNQPSNKGSSKRTKTKRASKKTSTKKTSTKKSSTKKTSTKKSSTKKSSTKKTGAKKTSTKKTSTKKSWTNDSLENQPVSNISHNANSPNQHERKFSLRRRTTESIFSNTVQEDPLIINQEMLDAVMDAIMDSESFWLIFKHGQYGMAGFLDIPSNRIYLELIFYPKGDPQYPFELFSPMEHNIDLASLTTQIRETHQEKPIEIWRIMNEQIRTQFMAYYMLLDIQLDFITKKYENQEVDDKYHRRVFLYYKKNQVEVDVDFRAYPDHINIHFLTPRFKKVNIQEFDVMQNWNPAAPPYLNEIFEAIEHFLCDSFNIPYSEYSQTVTLSGLKLPFTILDFSIHRGDVLGILVDDLTKAIILFDTLEGLFPIMGGSIYAFGQELSKYHHNPIVSLRFPYDTGEKEQKQKRKWWQFKPRVIETSKFSYHIDTNIKKPKLHRDDTLQSARIFDYLHKLIKKSTNPLIPRFTSKWFHEFMAILTLNHHSRLQQVEDLTDFEYLRFVIGTKIIEGARCLLINVPEQILTPLEISQFRQFIAHLLEKYHVAIILLGQHQYLTECERIVDLTANSLRTYASEVCNLLNELPEGEIITIELDSSLNSQIDRFLALPQIKIIPIRLKEKYLIFSERNIDGLILQLFQIFGSSLYHFVRTEPTLGDYLEFTNKK